jgi:hypothetical protein
LRKWSPGFSLLINRHGEGAAAQSLEFSSQTLCLFQVFHGNCFGGCHCRFGHRRPGALFNELGVFAGEGRLEELFDRKARLVAVHDGHGLLGHCSCFTFFRRSFD